MSDQFHERGVALKNLTACYDLPDRDRIKVNRLSAQRAWIELSGWLVVVVPFDADELEPVDASREKLARVFTEGAQSASMQLTLGALAQWALRRAGRLTVEHCFECGEDEWNERQHDYQRVLGAVFDRNWLRDGLQWLYEQRTPLDSLVSLSLERHPAKEYVDQEFPLLIMRCGEWCAALMCCKASMESVGSDPLEAA